MLMRAARRRPSVQIVAALVLAVAAVAPAFAQGAGGAIVGTTLDAQGGALPGVPVTVRNADTGVNRTAVTDGEGRYRIAGLPPGPLFLDDRPGRLRQGGRRQSVAHDRERAASGPDARRERARRGGQRHR